MTEVPDSAAPITTGFKTPVRKVKRKKSGLTEQASSEEIRVRRRREPPPEINCSKYYSKLVIDPENPYKRGFSFIITLLALISTFLSTYLACFGFPGGRNFFYFYYIMECFFALDIVLSFFTSYLDKETATFYKEFKPIAYKYLMSGFIKDVLATFPFHILFLDKFRDPQIKDQMLLLFLLKMLRFGKMVRIFDTKSFQDFIKARFRE